MVAALLTLPLAATHGDTYLESGGRVAVEAVHFDKRTVEEGGPHHFAIVPDEDPVGYKGPVPNSRTGRYMQVIPGADQNRNSGGLDVINSAPYMDYKLQITTTGDYQLYVRSTSPDGSSDSGYAQILELATAAGGPGPDWYRYNTEQPAGANDFATCPLNADDASTVNQGWMGFAGKEVQNGGGGDEPAIWTISKAGTYTLRWSQREAGTPVDAFILQLKTLVAPTDPGAPESQKVGAVPQPLTIASLTPAANSKAAKYNSAVGVVFADGTTKLATNSITLKLDGTNVAPTITQQSGGGTTVNYQPPSLFAPTSSHTATVSYSDDKGSNFTQSWSFTVQDYVIPSPALKVTPDTSKPGFIWDMSQVASVGSDSQNSNQRTLDQLAGLLGPNIADPNAQGVAAAPGTPNSDPNLPIRFEIPTVISLDRNGNNWGSWTGGQMPGSPGTAGGTDNQAARIITYITLPAGVVRMGVNSDDGFRTLVGVWNDIFSQQFLGEFDGGRGAGDTTFTFVVPEAGTYPFFTIWENGGGDSRIAWFTVNAGKQVLVNDTANGGLKAYRAAVGGSNKAGARLVLPAPGETAAAPDKVRVELVDGASPIDKSTVSLKLDGAAVTATITKTANVTTIAYSPAALFAGQSSHTAELDYTEAGTLISRTWKFTVAPYTKDKLHSYLASFLGAAAYTPGAGGHTAKPGDFGIDLGKSGANSVLISDASFLNIAATNDTMSFSIWVKKYDIANSSVFWAVSPSTGADNRGFQAHTPWSDDNVYFDTAGCCGADTRLNDNINTFAPYNAVGNDSWWTNWHHFLFSKQADLKKIWIDGQLFKQGNNTGVLPTDFTKCYLGAENGNINNMHAVIDDFAVFATAVSDANVALLAKGTLPTALTGEQLLAYWDFEDAPAAAPAAGPKLTAIKSGTNVTISWTTTPGFSLKSTSSLTKPITWTAVSQTPTTSGSTSTVTVPIGTGSQFFQLAQ